MTHILALSGSLRAASQNTMLLRAAARLAPPGIRVSVYPGLGELPLFNPDHEFPHPHAVAALKTGIHAADALLIASPEYAHGVTGTIKNALDWMVGNESFVRKPVAVLNAAPRATHAHASLCETLTMMSAHLIAAACITMPFPLTAFSEDDMVRDPVIAAVLVNLLNTIHVAINN